MLTANSLPDAALAYRQRGWTVTPVRPRNKVPVWHDWPVISQRLGPEDVETVWTRWPETNIGLVTGISFDVLDIDGEAGLASLHRLIAPATYTHRGPIVRTGSGGWHFYFRPTGEANRGQMLPKVDWRGVGGQVVAPPSVHPNGTRYRWLTNHGPDTPLPDAPEWLRALLAKKYIDPAPRRTPRGRHYDNEDAIAVAGELGIRVSRGLKAVCPFHPQTPGNRSLQFYPDGHFYCHAPGCHVFGWGQHLRSGIPLRN
jgi:hypothetical protein